MVDVLVVLIVLAEKNVLVVHDDLLPTVEYSTKISPFDLASQLLERYTNIKALKNGAGWVPLLHRPVIQDKDRLYIPYLCILPEAVKIHAKEARWCPLVDCATFFTKNQKVMESI